MKEEMVEHYSARIKYHFSEKQSGYVITVETLRHEYYNSHPEEVEQIIAGYEKTIDFGMYEIHFQKHKNEMEAREVIRSWKNNQPECRNAFGYTLDEFIFFGGYPRTAFFKDDESRWIRFMRESIIEPTISQDILAMTAVKKPTLMRSLFNLGIQFSSQELSYNKMLGQLQDAGNTTTLAHYLDLLSKAGMLSALMKFDMQKASSRKSSPRLIAHDSSLLNITARLVHRSAHHWYSVPRSLGTAYQWNVGQQFAAPHHDSYSNSLIFFRMETSPSMWMVWEL